MRAAEAIFLIAVFAAIVVAIVLYFGSHVVAWWKSSRRQHAVEADVWHVDIDKQGQETVVQVIKALEEPYYIGAIPISLPYYEYDERLTELRLEADAKAESMNRKLINA